MSWINDYVGVPYRESGRDRSGWDCWGLVLAVYHDRLAMRLPDWQWTAPHTLANKLRTFDRAISELTADALADEIAAPEPWALALVYQTRRPHHVGVVVGEAPALGVLHAQRYGGTIYDPLARFLATYRGASWLRWRR